MVSTDISLADTDGACIENKIDNSFYEKYNTQIRAVVARILRNANQINDIDDCVNTVFLSIIEKLEQYNETRGSMGTFVTVISRSVALNYIKTNNRKTSELVGDDNIDILSFPMEYQNEIEFNLLVESITAKLNNEYTLSDDGHGSLTLKYTASDKMLKQGNNVTGDWVNNVLKQAGRQINPEDPKADKRTVEITLPENVILASLDVNVINGNINVSESSIKGINIKSVNGNIEIRDSNIATFVIAGKTYNNVQNETYKVSGGKVTDSKSNIVNGMIIYGN